MKIYHDPIPLFTSGWCECLPFWFLPFWFALLTDFGLLGSGGNFVKLK